MVGWGRGVGRGVGRGGIWGGGGETAVSNICTAV